MTSTVSMRFPLEKAYAFAERHGLSVELTPIRQMRVNWRGKYTYNSTVRRGYIIELFKRYGLFDDFLRHEWPRGLTEGGSKECDSCLRVMREYEDLHSLA